MSCFQANGTVDTHLLSAAWQGRELATRFSWRGFQVAIVTASGGATFRGRAGDARPLWTGIKLDQASAVTFSGGTGSGMLGDIHALVARGLHSNIVTGLPTDCPTREKHAWLGDALDAAGGVMSNWMAQSVYRLFLDQAAAGYVRRTCHLPFPFSPSGHARARPFRSDPSAACLVPCASSVVLLVSSCFPI